MNNFNLATCKYDFTSDNVNIFLLLYDCSGSMADYERQMRQANEAFRSDFLNFDDVGSVAIAKALFSEDVIMSSFESVEKFDTDYFANGGTRLYRAIAEVVKKFLDYYEEITKRLNIRAKITFLIFSDGEDNDEYDDEIAKAQESILRLNSLDATTVFVAFGSAVSRGIGENLGCVCTKDINNVEELICYMGKELSKSCKEQSKSAYSLKSNFFSQADGATEDDSLEEEAIFDEDFWDL